MDQSSLVPSANQTPSHLDDEEIEGSKENVNKGKDKSKLDYSHAEGNDEKISRVDERSVRGQPTVDIAEVLRRWTHALQRIHKQSLQLVCCFVLIKEFCFGREQLKFCGCLLLSVLRLVMIQSFPLISNCVLEPFLWNIVNALFWWCAGLSLK